MSNLRLGELRYVVIPGDVPKDAWSVEYEEAFRCWKAVWAETFGELDGNAQIFSDDFSRQSFMGCLFQKTRCVSLGFFHRVDFTFAVAAQDSYFKVWPPEVIAKLVAEGPHVLVGSNITVDPQYRGDLGNGLHLKNVLIGLMVKTFLETDADAMTGTMRCDRNMASAAARYGAAPLLNGVIHHGVEVELMAFYRRQLLKSGFVLDLGVETLWRNRDDFRGTPVSGKRTARRGKR